MARIYFPTSKTNNSLWGVLARSLVISLLPTSCVLNSKALAQEDEESAYVKYASQLVKESNNSTSKNATTIPLPEAATGPPIPAKGYLVQQIRDHLYWVTDGGYNTGLDKADPKEFGSYHELIKLDKFKFNNPTKN
ncbi:MAG: hypothetical protein WBE68_15135 [Candidatus Nitrosopolaris sp.]